MEPIEVEAPRSEKIPEMELKIIYFFGENPLNLSLQIPESSNSKTESSVKPPASSEKVPKDTPGRSHHSNVNSDLRSSPTEDLIT